MQCKCSNLNTYRAQCLFMDTVHLLIYETCILYNYTTAFITQQLLNALQNMQSARAVLYIARPSDCPHLSVHLSHGWINQKRLVKIMQFSHTVNPYLQFLRHKFHSEILADSPERGRQTRVEMETSYFLYLYASIFRKRYKIKIGRSHC